MRHASVAPTRALAAKRPLTCRSACCRGTRQVSSAAGACPTTVDTARHGPILLSVIVLAHPDGSSDDSAVDPTHPLALRWARVAALGMQRESDGYPTGPGDAQLAERRARLQDIFREEHALLGPMATELAARSFCAVVADAEGVVLASHDG